MVKLVNIHCHMLYGVDDGAKDPEMMMRMIDAAYKSGVRVICMTPHYNPAVFRCPPDVIKGRFDKAKSYASEKYPDLKLCLGQEMYCYHSSVEDLLCGRCLTLNDTRYVLAEFGPSDDKSTIRAGVTRLLTSGFIPVVAHVERYSATRGSKSFVRELKEQGALVQINATSVIGEYGIGTKLYALSLIKKGLVDVVADDCHRPDGTDKNLRGRRVCLREAYDEIKKKLGEDTAQRLCCGNPLEILNG